ncbi:MAG: alanine--tRNA ligase [Succiniclasticum sp.]|jgi:alanyl-tRNA synthetase|nr:alanine--tRNA ligase [Succiniclasticum sp.]MDY2869455.1 alanine--tRNA ligase [Succiniclasticum sp.]
MKYMSGNEIRKRFLQFFQDRGHLWLPSASLIPQDDPTLLLIGAGMAPFKPFFTGKLKPPSPRITTCQKCVRTGDIENVGRTARHHTFFEMLGDFSFGDYFKKEIIPWSWEFLTKELELPANKLYITIHTKDDEAYQIWHDVVGVEDSHIIRLEDNFWEIGSGPCGPCSEIHIDLGEERGCGKPDCGPDCDCGRFLELWNLVFTQYNQNEDGTYTPLQHKNIDTGAGLERLASVLQGKPSNFETDLMFPIVEYASRESGVVYNSDRKKDVSLKVIADHARSLVFMIGDGILPSNEGRGYILRRILRRAVRHGRLLGIDHEFLGGAVDVVVQMFGEFYPEIKEKQDYIKKVIHMEESSFLKTLKSGSELLDSEIAAMKEAGKTVLDGAAAFKLSDTFGFPKELTQEILQEQGLTMDEEGFAKELEAQRQRARDARDDKTGRPVIYNDRDLNAAALKVDEEAGAGKILKLYPLQDAQPVESISDGKDAAVILDVTAFHAEGGGQVGDIGTLKAPAGVLQVTKTKKLPDGVTYMAGTVVEGTLNVGDEVTYEVDRARKADVARNHTATHLLQAALREVLGDHVNQAGSYVGPDRLHFDFSHFSPMTAEELARVETLVNDQILAGKTVTFEEMPIAEAKKRGARALFGEKYGSIVRVVTVPDFSMELCGGVHVRNTAQIGFFKIVSESSSGAGVRRIEAVTGHGALAYVKGLQQTLGSVADRLHCRPTDVEERLDVLTDEVKAANQKVKTLEAKLDAAAAKAAGDQVRDIQGVKALVQKVSVADVPALRTLGDRLRDTTQGVVVLASVFENGKIGILAMATKEAVGKGVHCGNIVKEVAKLCGGGGGGRPDMAQAGGKDAAKLDEALAAAWGVLEGQVR